MTNFLQAIHGEIIKVVNINYYETSRGVGFNAETNYGNVRIYNDGTGGMTQIEPPSAYKLLDLEYCPHDVWQKAGEPELKPDGTPYTKWDTECLCDASEEHKIEEALHRLVSNYENAVVKPLEELWGNKPWVCESEYAQHITYDKHPALSRRDNATYICSECGQREAIDDYRKSLMNEEEE